MKRIVMAIALILVATMLSSCSLINETSQAEPVHESVPEVEWQANIPALMASGNVPSIAEIEHTIPHNEGEKPIRRDIACEVTIDGVNYGCEFVFETTAEPVSDLGTLKSWLGSVVIEAACTAGGDCERLAQAIDAVIASQYSGIQPNADGNSQEHADAALQLGLIRVSTPFYPELSMGKDGEPTQRLQEKLLELGFLVGKADGYFGKQTEAAVKELESYVRELEQDLIDDLPDKKTSTVPVTAELLPKTTKRQALTLMSKTEQSSDTVTMPVAVDEPLPTPVTAVDGIADGMLQAYLFSEDYKIARRDLRAGDSGADVARMQRRLRTLGCSADEADGNFGTNTARSVRIFQQYNDLSVTGEADLAMLTLLFSDKANSPEYALLAQGSSGEAVKTLQTRLRELGFTNAASDGEYGAATRAAVEELQTYIRECEAGTIHADDPTLAPDADVSGKLTTEVNGIADPLLLEALYSSDFTEVISKLDSGDSGEDVLRLQRRLYGLEYIQDEPDGNFGEMTVKAVKTFQRRHRLPETGVADAATTAKLFSSDALKALMPYELHVSIDDQRVYAYIPDVDGNYTELVRTMTCSTGRNSTPTPKGTFKTTTGPGARWHYFTKFNCWAQYAYYIQGDILFHSVLYSQKEGSPTQSSINNLGHKASHGCVRLSVEDAKWIWTNCPKNTTVVVY